MIGPQENFQRPDRNNGAPADFAAGKEFGSNVVLDRARRDAQHRRRLAGADGKFVLLFHARNVRQRGRA